MKKILYSVVFVLVFNFMCFAYEEGILQQKTSKENSSNQVEVCDMPSHSYFPTKKDTLKVIKSYKKEVRKLKKEKTTSKVYNTVNEAAAVLKKNMLNRTTSINIKIAVAKSKKLGVDKIFCQIWDKACEHTRKCNEGDYLNDNVNTKSIASTMLDQSNTSKYIYTYKINLKYNTTKAEENTLAKKVKSIISSFKFTKTTSSYTKVKKIYDYLCKHVTYDYKNADNYRIKYSAYGALIKKRAVCQGYASAFYYLSLLAGIDCRIIGGLGCDEYGCEPHAWNIVKLGNYYYNLDVTWDSCNYSEYWGYDYFLKGENNSFTKEHIRNSGKQIIGKNSKGKLLYENEKYSFTCDNFTSKAFKSKYKMSSNDYKAA